MELKPSSALMRDKSEGLSSAIVAVVRLHEFGKWAVR